MSMLLVYIYIIINILGIKSAEHKTGGGEQNAYDAATSFTQSKSGNVDTIT